MKYIILLLLLLCSCAEIEPEHQIPFTQEDLTRLVDTEFGIVLHNCAITYSNFPNEQAWMTSSREDSIIVRQVLIIGSGEVTLGEWVLPSDGSICFPSIRVNHGFYFYSFVSGRTFLGYLSGRCPDR